MLNILAHERLAIVDPNNGAQPLYNATHSIALAVNGEIWNHRALRSSSQLADYAFATESDCEPIIPLYERHGDDFIHQLDGIFAFVLSDEKNNHFFAARDPIGVCPLYVGWGKDGSLWFASEFKALANECERFQEFPPGHYWSSKTNTFVRWYTPPWIDEHIPSDPLDLVALRMALEKSVVKRLMTDVP